MPPLVAQCGWISSPDLLKKLDAEDEPAPLSHG